MRKVVKVFLIIATVCLLAGVALSATAFAVSGFDIQKLSTAQPMTQQHYTSSQLNELKSIAIANVDDDVQLKYADVQNIEVDYWENNKVTYKFAENSSQGSLDITQDFGWFRGMFNIGWYPAEDHPIIITVPRSFAGSLAINTVSGAVLVDEPSATLVALEVSTVSSNIDYSLKQVDRIVVKSVSGTVAGQVSGDVASATYSSVSADLNLQFGQVRSLTAENVSGNIDVKVAERLDVTYKFVVETLSGDIDVPASANAATNNVLFKTVSGDAKFAFAPQSGY